MAKYLEVLPDPNYKILPSGKEDATGVAGQGFANIKLSQSDFIEAPKTLTGKTIWKKSKQAKWLLDIKYNPMTLEEFAPVYNFITQKKHGLVPFFISLPQYKEPKDATFATFAASTGYDITVSGDTIAGSSTLLLTSSSWSGDTYTSTGLPFFGDIFTITDSNDSLHVKTYMVARVETMDTYVTSPGTGNIRIHITPGLQRKVNDTAIINFDNPLLRVNQLTDMQEYSLGNNNLYTFSLKLEEALY
jgi:hypothetical protein